MHNNTDSVIRVNKSKLIMCRLWQIFESKQVWTYLISSVKLVVITDLDGLSWPDRLLCLTLYRLFGDDRISSWALRGLGLKINSFNDQTFPSL